MISLTKLVEMALSNTSSLGEQIVSIFKQTLYEQLTRRQLLFLDLACWIEPNGKIWKDIGEHDRAAYEIVKKLRMEIDESGSIQDKRSRASSILFDAGWIRQRGCSFECKKLTSREKDTIFIRAKEIDCEKIYVETEYNSEVIFNEPPEALYEQRSLVEMVMPRETDKLKTYYHGTKDKNNALKIAKEGLKPQDIEFLEKKYVIPDNDEAGQEVDRQYMSISGRVYLTEDLFSAIQYASPGSGFELKGNQAKGYVVVVSGNKIQDIEPDEDDVGSIILNIGNYVRSPKQYPLSFKIRAKHLIELHKIAIKYLGEEYWKKFFNEPQVGKVILPHLSDGLKHTIIDIGGKVAHVGPIDIDEVWEFDIKDYYNLYSQDKKSRKSTIDEFVNNFFSKYARRIK